MSATERKKPLRPPNMAWGAGDAEIAALQKRTGASVLTLYRVDCPASTLVSSIFFDGSDFLWCTKGSFRFEFSDREPVVLHEGEFIVTFSGRFVTIVGLGKSNALRGGILAGHRNEEFLLRLGFWDCFVCQSVFSEHNLSRLQELIDQRTQVGGTADFALLRYAHFLLQSVLTSLSTGRDALFYGAIRHINVGFLDGNASVKAVCADLRCSAPYLIRIFKAHGFSGPSEYLYRLQSWWACRLLGRTRLTIGEIAEECGFSNGSSFTRFFRRWIGLSPADIRNGVAYSRHPPAAARKAKNTLCHCRKHPLSSR